MEQRVYSDEILNTALELATEWGENFRKPINDRILAKFPDLNDDDITELTKFSREAESYIYALAERELSGEISESDIAPLLAFTVTRSSISFGGSAGRNPSQYCSRR